MRAVTTILFTFFSFAGHADEPTRPGCLDPYLYACYELSHDDPYAGTDFFNEEVWIIEELYTSDIAGSFTRCHVKVRYLSDADEEIDMISLENDRAEYVVYYGKQMLRAAFDVAIEKNNCSALGEQL